MHKQFPLQLHIKSESKASSNEETVCIECTPRNVRFPEVHRIQITSEACLAESDRASYSF